MIELDLSYDEVRRIHRLEKNSSNLVEVDEDFYNSLKLFLADEKKSYFESLKDLSSSSVKARDFSNLKKMVEEIFVLREKKLLNKALVCARTNDSFDFPMAVQEKKMISEIVGILKKHNKLLESLFSGGSKSEDRGKGLNTLSVEILSDIPQFVGVDMKNYGPFKSGDVVELPLEVAKVLSKRKLVEVKS